MRHIGTLPDEYKQKLETMTLSEIATEAARFRSNGKRPGTATALILKWTMRNRLARDDESAKAWFHGLYCKAWSREKSLRMAELSERPVKRPVTGGRRKNLLTQFV